MSEQPICGKCGLPIHQAETGLRYFGNYIAHNENRCLELLRSNSEALERQLADVRGELEQCNQRVKDYQSDVADLEGANESLSDLRQSAEGERDNARQAFADEVIALITTEQAAMCRLYSKDKYGINKVCNRLKLFVGDLLKKPLPASDVDKPEGDTNA